MKTFDKFIRYDGKEYYVMGSYKDKKVDDSFSHEFGVEQRSHLEVVEFEIDFISLELPDGPEELNWDTIRKGLKEAITDEVMQMDVC